METKLNLHSLGLEKLNNEDLNEVNGGHPLVLAAAAAIGVGAVWETFHSIGENIGKAVYHATH